MTEDENDMNIVASVIYRFIVVILISTISIIFYAKCIRDDQEENIYYMIYRVYYNQDNIREYSVTNDGPIYVGSDRGSNFIKRYSITGPTIIKTTAPIEVVSYTRIPESE